MGQRGHAGITGDQDRRAKAYVRPSGGFGD